MFDTVEMIMDVFGRPIFVLPEELSEGECSIKVGEDSVEFFSGTEKVGAVEIEEPAILHLVGTQPEIGIIVWDETKVPECPSTLTHVARVIDKRDLAA